jgi:hypothetical protein
MRSKSGEDKSLQLDISENHIAVHANAGGGRRFTVEISCAGKIVQGGL